MGNEISPGFLKVDVNASSEHSVGTMEPVGTVNTDGLTGYTQILRITFIEVLVVGPEIGNVDTCVFCYLKFGTKATGIAASHKAHVGEIAAVAEGIMGALSACADCDVFIDVPFHTGQIFLCVASEKFCLSSAIFASLSKK